MPSRPLPASAGPFGRLGRPFVLTALVALAGCASSGAATGEKKEGSVFTRMFGGSGSSSKIDPNYFLESGFCPPLTVRPGTESYTVRTGKEESTANVKFLATVDDVARECHYTGAELNLKIGVRGRVVAGPQGGQGKVTLPIRIVAIKNGDTVILSQLTRLDVVLDAAASAGYTHVVTVSIPSPAEDRDVRLHAGLDATGKSDPLGKIKPPTGASQ